MSHLSHGRKVRSACKSTVVFERVLYKDSGQSSGNLKMNGRGPRGHEGGTGAHASLFGRIVRFLSSDSSIRNLTGFLFINLGFGVVELVYGLSTNSLSLISDAFHMFFDCTGLIIGLVASFISQWKPNDKYSYGYGRAEVLGSFVNCIILIFIAFFILAEAVERSFEPPEVKHERLLAVSFSGLLVNLLGIVAFKHGGDDEHGHSHHGHSHHGHSHHGRSHSVDVETHWDSPGAAHPPKHGHSLIKQGIFLHIVADTLGSVGVIISSLIIQYYGWMKADIICSVLIALLILGSGYPLTKECYNILMQRTPDFLSDALPRCYKKLMLLPGVYRIEEPHFWTLHSNKHVGSLTLEVSRTCDINTILNDTKSIFLDVGIHHVNVQFVYAVM